MLTKPPMKIVLTGGPSAGKTTVAEAVVRAYWDRLHLVPEGASILFRGGFPRDSVPAAVVCQQRAIYHVQHELEELAALGCQGHSIICDRGTLDGLAYWPESENEFFVEIKSTMDAEIARYDWVIHLETADMGSYQPSSIRRESYVEAKAIDERVKAAWRTHPRRLILRNSKNFSMKITLALLAIKMILDGEPIQKIEELLEK